MQHQPHRLPRFTEKVYFDLIITLLRYDRRQTKDCDWGVNPMSAVGRGMVTLEARARARLWIVIGCRLTRIHAQGGEHPFLYAKALATSDDAG